MNPNWRGIILEPLYVMVEPLVVTRQIPKLEEDAGPGNTETDALESTKNSRRRECP